MPYTLSIPTTSLHTTPSSSPFTQYHLTITTPLRTTVLKKRYSDFSTLHGALTSSCAAAPPAPLPSKSWFSRTVNNPELTEQRRQGLEQYVRAIEESTDSRWRESSAYRTFLGFPPADSNHVTKRALASSDSPVPQSNMTATAWLDLHSTMKQHLHDARSSLTRREAASTVTAAHEASAMAKKSLVKAHTLILRLEDGLKGLSEGRNGGERLGDGEVRRRRDLVARARMEREALEGVLNAWVAKSSQFAQDIPPSGKKEELFSGARNGSPLRSSGSSMPGSFPQNQTSTAAPRAGRVLGAPVKETERTRELDNEGVLKLQQKIMQEQDMDVEQLAVVVRRMREMGVAINEELVEQSTLLDMLDQDVDRVGGKIDVAKKRLKKIR